MFAERHPQAPIPVEGFAKLFIAIVGTWAMRTSLKEFAKKRAFIWLGIIEGWHASAIKSIEEFKSRNPRLVPSNYDNQLMKVFSNANHSMKENIHSVLLDPAMPGILNSEQ